LDLVARLATVQGLATSVAHELNQPLGAILSNAEVVELTALKDLPPDHPLYEVLSDIVAQARRAASIIGDLRKAIDTQSAAMVPLSLNVVVDEVASLVGHDTLPGSLHIELQLADTIPMTMGSAVQIRQVILNLVANARDAIQRAQCTDGRIVIATQRIDDLWLAVTVTDNGDGISPDSIDQLFKPSPMANEGRAGMGLWISQMIAEQHGGSLRCGNNAGRGAWFTLMLPVLLRDE
jgi:C4-dicarboxylate-specific signal transduction histidine kinase